jgi:RimJ/RimL family protein N-acetyltransferase
VSSRVVVFCRRRWSFDTVGVNEKSWADARKGATVTYDQPTIHVIDAESGLASALNTLLQVYGIGVYSYPSVTDFLGASHVGHHDRGTLFLSLDFDGYEPTALLEEVRSGTPGMSIIAVAAETDAALHRRVLSAGALDLVRRSLLAAYVFNRLQRLQPDATGLPHTKTSTLSLRDGSEVTFRMMQPEDADIEQAFVTALSDRSRYLRFFSGLRRLPRRQLAVLTNPEFPLSYALIATISVTGEERQIGVARYAPTGDERVAEFAVVVSDEWQGNGIGSQLLHLVISAAAVAGMRRLEGLVLRENAGMLALAKKLGFVLEADGSADVSAVRVSKDLTGRDAAQRQ